ncbi:MAG: response regulator transcription factor [Deltaproteobacteria bacterium]|nr:response regulator transcription factor [Deltaproteobacteria bacterium]
MNSTTLEKNDGLSEFEHRLLLVDDDAFNRDGMRPFFIRAGFKVFEAGDEDNAWQIIQQKNVDVAILDLAIPAEPGAATDHDRGSLLAWRIKQSYPDIGIVLFSAYEDVAATFLDKVKEGIRGIAYQLKGCSPADLLKTVNEVMAGKVLIDNVITVKQQASYNNFVDKLTDEEKPYVEYAVSSIAALPPRLLQVTRFLANSFNVDGISKALNVSHKTAENYIGQVYDRLGLTEMGHVAPNLRKSVIIVKSCMLYDLSYN